MNHPRVRAQNLTRSSMTGTSISTPTTVASAAPEESPNSMVAVAMCGRYDGPIHLVLSDILMPGMSGTEACEAIRRLRPETRVLFMSGFNDGKNTFGVGHASDGFIQKPFTLNNLLDKCRQILGHH